jgi:hypothetical protein
MEKERWAGGKKKGGRERELGRAGRKKQRERWVGLEKEKGRERDEVFLKKILFKVIFQTFKIELFSNFKFKLFSKHFNPFQNFQIILKTFKTSHKQIKPCIRIMMHKHLLLLNY